MTVKRVAIRELVVKDRTVTCPRTSKKIDIKTCFGCVELKSVQPRDNGILECVHR